MLGLSVARLRGLVRFAAWAELVLGLAVSGYAFHYVSQQVDRDARARFEAECTAIEKVVAMHLASYTDLLLGLAGFINHDPRLTRAQFRDYANSLDLHNRHSGVTSVNYATQLAASARAAFEQGVRRDRSILPGGVPDFAIVPPGARASYHPLSFVEPLLPGIALLGVDQQAYTEGAAEVFAEMRDSGDIVSAPDVMADGHQWGVRLAIYRAGAPLNTVEQRRAALSGSVGLRFSLSRLMQTALTPQSAARIRLRLYSYARPPEGTVGFVPAAHHLLMDSASLWPAGAASSEPGAALGMRLERPFGGVILGMEFGAAMDDFRPLHERVEPYFIGLLGALSTLLLFVLIRSLLRARFDLEGAVTERTRELSELYERVRSERDQRIRLEREILTVAEDERARLGRELHDDLGQMLTATACLAQSLSQDLEDRWKEGARQAGAIEGYLSGAVEKARLLSQGLMPLASQVGSISLALEQLARHARESFRVGCQVSTNPVEIVESPEVAQELYRIAQEAVLNAVKHGHASSILIELTRAEATQRLSLLVIDNGVGVDPERVRSSTGVGMRIMRRRSRTIGMDISIERHPEGGTILRVE